MNTIPIKRVVVTIDGNRYQIEIPTTMQEQEVFETITTCKRLMAEFYFTALVTTDNYMLLFEQQMQKAGIYKHQQKKNFRLLQASVRKIINTMRSTFSYPDYFEELSACVWDDTKDDIRKLQYAVFLVFGRNGYNRAESETYAMLTTLANLIYITYESYKAVIEQVRLKSGGVRLTELMKEISCDKILSFVASWCRSYIRNFEEIEEKVTSDSNVIIGREAYSQKIFDIDKLHDREFSAFEGLDEDFKINWKPMSERPNNRRRVIVFRDNKKCSYLYNKGFLYDKENKIAWEENNSMWVYENERDKQVEYVA